jgi:succinyl-CoA synthetase alpha subunit
VAILATESTRIIIQGITGREAAAVAKDSLDYGAKIVAGVTPGKGGTEIYGVPVFDTMQEALSAHPAEASVISVPAAFAKDARWKPWRTRSSSSSSSQNGFHAGMFSRW